MARRWRIEAVQQNTSLEVQMSHSSGPRIQEALIYNIQIINAREEFVTVFLFVLCDA